MKYCVCACVGGNEKGYVFFVNRVVPLYVCMCLNCGGTLMSVNCTLL